MTLYKCVWGATNYFYFLTSIIFISLVIRHMDQLFVNLHGSYYIVVITACTQKL